MELLSTTYNLVVSYLMTIRVTDVIDMAIIAFVVYNILIRLRSTTSVRILQDSGCAAIFLSFFSGAVGSVSSFISLSTCSFFCVLSIR